MEDKILHNAIEINHVNFIRKYINKNHNIKNDRLLNIAIDYKKTDIIDLLISSKANISCGLYHCFCNGNIEMFEYLINKGADINSISSIDYLMDCIHTINIFIKYYPTNIPIDVFNKYFPYYLNSRFNTIEQKEEIVKFYSKILPKDKFYRFNEKNVNIYHFLLAKAHSHNNRFDDDISDIIALLLRYEFNPNIKDDDGRTTIDWLTMNKSAGYCPGVGNRKEKYLKEFFKSHLLDLRCGLLTEPVENELKRRKNIRKDIDNMRFNIDNYLSLFPIEILKIIEKVIIYN